MSKRTVGIVGGMGPLATADLFQKIIESTPAKKDQDHLRIVVDNNPEIPDRTAFILGKGPDPRPLLIETAKNVEKMGADFLVIPCNTAHYFHADVQSSVRVPLLHIMQEVAKHLSGKVSAAGILASTGTLQTKLYETHLEAAGVRAIVPSSEIQQLVMDSIYGVKAGDLKKGRELALKCGEYLISLGAQAVIAGCTEIPLVLHDGDLAVPVIDPTRILAQACVREALH